MLERSVSRRRRLAAPLAGRFCDNATNVRIRRNAPQAGPLNEHGQPLNLRKTSMRNCFFQFLAALCLFSYALPAHAGDAKAIAALTAAGAKVTLISGGGTRVDVPDGKLSDDLWKSLEALGDLKVFSVKGTQFNNAAVEHLSKIATIEAIVIYNPGFDDKGLAMLANLPELKSINIDHGTTINGSGLAAFAGKKLEKFNIG